MIKHEVCLVEIEKETYDILFMGRDESEKKEILNEALAFYIYCCTEVNAGKRLCVVNEDFTEIKDIAMEGI